MFHQNFNIHPFIYLFFSSLIRVFTCPAHLGEFLLHCVSAPCGPWLQSWPCPSAASPVELVGRSRWAPSAWDILGSLTPRGHLQGDHPRVHCRHRQAKGIACFLKPNKHNSPFPAELEYHVECSGLCWVVWNRGLRAPASDYWAFSNAGDYVLLHFHHSVLCPSLVSPGEFVSESDFFKPSPPF